MFGTLSRGPGDQFDEQKFADLGPLQGQLEPGTALARRAEELRASARRAFIREEFARAVFRKAAPLVGEHATGDIVCLSQGRPRMVARLSFDRVFMVTKPHG